MSAIDPALIKQLLAKERAPRGPRAKKDTRDYDTWFDTNRHTHILDKACEVPEHEDNILLFEFVTTEDFNNALSRDRVVIDHNGILMCRYCFISGAGLSGDD